MPCVHSGQGQQLCSFFFDSAVRASQTTCGKVGLLEALVLTAGPGRSSCGLLGDNPFETLRDSVWLGSTLSRTKQTGDGILTGMQRKGKAGVERTLDQTAIVWFWFYKKCSHRKSLRIVTCKLVLVRAQFSKEEITELYWLLLRNVPC